ncbi:MAG: pantoate--beta-alanine ligase [Victivallales bacterium]|nr:pantoate--beta-alanine ligase [Victivallales bacterium]MBQ6473974.1 pantoate--beta-alanine ligase [Victivallales bacterium]
MELLTTVAAIRERVTAWKKAGERIAVVPTMGYLHDGHLSLMRIARQNADRVVTTIFVNPTQFGPTEDLDKYPRDLEHDRRLCEEVGVDAIFHPSPAEMYAPDFSTWVSEDSLSQTLCGAFRPIHFRGVCTVCLKLFNITMADVAVFGRKDAQQALVIERMVRDLNVPIKIIQAPLVREEDGLARSSRNKYLSAEERTRALALSRGLRSAQAKFDAGERDAQALKDAVLQELLPAADSIDYVDVMSRATLRPIGTIDQPALLAIAAYIGKTRLIDNLFLD